MYRILLVAKKADNYGSLYRYLTTTDDDGKIIPYEAADENELDTQVERMLNSDYSKNDFIIVTIKDYEIDADIIENNL